jgi:hypothetical protein
MFGRAMMGLGFLKHSPNSSAPPGADALLLEDGSHLLLEDGSKLLLE